MSKSVNTTKEKILDKGLEMFNERGIEYVGLRELAAVLEMRVSNITYYYPTKDDLVYAIATELGKENARLIVNRENLSMKDFLETFHQVFQNHVKYRCLLLSVVHINRQNKHMASEYKNTQKTRNANLKSILTGLESGGYLKLNEETDKDFLVSAISLISRFWISEAAISSKELSIQQETRQYLFLLTQLLTPYSTAKGKKEIQVFLAALE